MTNIVLNVENLTKTYATVGHSLTVLDNVSFTVEAGSSLAIVGPSGSGKTTLLALCAGLDIPSSGTVTLMQQSLHTLDEDGRARIRNEHVGFIFQNFQLLPTLTTLENVTVPLELRGKRNVTNKAKELLDRVGLASRVSHYPNQLSGGEQQRVALARAFMNSPTVLFADEPTGNLDEENAHHITELLFEINKEQNTTLIMVTHNNALAQLTNRILRMKGGSIVEEIIRTN
jgi:putative ABC transport system ATP-binding protein